MSRPGGVNHFHSLNTTEIETQSFLHKNIEAEIGKIFKNILRILILRLRIENIRNIESSTKQPNTILAVADKSYMASANNWSVW